MFCQQGEDVVDRVGGGEGAGGEAMGGEEAAQECEGCGEDAVEAEEREGIGQGEKEATLRGAGAVLLR